jgi:uncharacterized protein (DUF1919 family)
MLRRFKSSAHRRLGELRTSGLRARLRTQVRELDARGISIISNNCVAGILYEMAGLPKRSPTAGIYFSDLAYARFLDDLAKSRTEFWTELEPTDLVFNENQHCWALPVEPGGQLVFLHYPTAEDAVAKWRRRMDRSRGKTLFVISSILDGISLDSIDDPLKRFPYTFTIDGDPTPPADEIVLIPAFLRDLSSYVDSILSDWPHQPSDPLPVHRYN